MRRRLPPLPGLHAFEAFARAGSMSGAADALCVTHGAVSRQVRGLEARLGARLVVGPRHRLTLTPAGRDLAAALASAFDLIAAALPGAEAGTAEPLVISCYGTFAMKWLIPRLPGFLDAHPGHLVRIVESHAPVDFGGGVHAAIRIEDAEAHRGLRAVPFMAHHHGPVLSPALFAQIGSDLAAVLALPRLHSETFAPAWAQWAQNAGVVLPAASAERGFEHNSYMLEAAAAGMGAAVTPWAFAAADIERGRLTAPFGFQPLPWRFTYLRPRLGENPAALAFGEWLRAEGRRSPPPPPVRRVGATAGAR